MKDKSSVSNIAITCSLKKKGFCDEEYEEYDEVETVEHLKQEIERYGFKVVIIEQNDKFFENILAAKPDFVFNMAEGVGHTRAREAQVPCILESLKIPYSGSDPVTLGITLDKYTTSLMLKSAGIPVPWSVMVKNQKQTSALKNIFETGSFFIVKPRWEGSSKGIFLNSVVDNFRDLNRRVKTIFLKYKQPALVEEFLEEEEITAGVCGWEKSARVLGMMKIVPKDKNKKNFLYSLETKRDWQKQVDYENEKSIPKPVRSLIEEYALRACAVLELKDLARIDFRLDKKRVPKIIDVNPLPGLSPRYSDLPILYRLNGKTYSDLIKTILKESFKRHGFRWEKGD